MANVKLSASELALASDAEILLTKNRIIGKVYALLGNLAETYLAITAANALPAEILHQSPKISRGENYLGLAWVMLDYPRLFGGGNIVSIRTMFWWGRHFSLFLLLKGAWIHPLLLRELFNYIDTNHWFICVASDPWQHSFEEQNMISIANLSVSAIGEIIEQTGFLKIGLKIPINEWEFIEHRMSEHFTGLIKAIGTAAT